MKNTEAHSRRPTAQHNHQRGVQQDVPLSPHEFVRFMAGEKTLDEWKRNRPQKNNPTLQVRYRAPRLLASFVASLAHPTDALQRSLVTDVLVEVIIDHLVKTRKSKKPYGSGQKFLESLTHLPTRGDRYEVGSGAGEMLEFVGGPYPATRWRRIRDGNPLTLLRGVQNKARAGQLKMRPAYMYQSDWELTLFPAVERKFTRLTYSKILNRGLCVLAVGALIMYMNPVRPLRT